MTHKVHNNILGRQNLPLRWENIWPLAPLALPSMIVELILYLGLYRTSRPVRKSSKFSKSGLFGNWTFSWHRTFKDKKNPDFFFKFLFIILLLLLFISLVKCKKYNSRFRPVWQDLSGKFGCPVLSGQETHMPILVEPFTFPLHHYISYINWGKLKVNTKQGTKAKMACNFNLLIATAKLKVILFLEHGI